MLGFKRCARSMAAACCWSLAALTTTVALAAAPRDGARDTVDPEVVPGLSAFDIQDLLIQPSPSGIKRIAVKLGTQSHVLNLEPHSIRTPGFRVLVQGDDGELREVAAPAPRTVRGTVAGVPGSRVAGSVTDGAMSLTILLPDGEQWFVEPSASLAPWTAQQGNGHLVYRRDDVIPTNNRCGADHVLHLAGISTDPVPTAAGGAVGGETLTLVDLAFDADSEYFAILGNPSAVVSDIETVMSHVNAIYESHLQISFRIPSITVRNGFSDPYTATDSLLLLCEFRNFWTTEMGDISRDLAHLMTGSDLDGTIIGRAWLGSVCNDFIGFDCGGLQGAFGYGISQTRWSSIMANRVGITAHELGHNFDACHCDQVECTGGGVDGDCGIMRSIIQGSASVGDRAVTAMTAHRDSRTCLSIVPVVCDGAAPIFVGDTVFDTTSTTSSGVPLPVACDEGFGTEIGKDLWYVYTPPFDGILEVSTCSQANFDTRIAAYGGTCDELVLAACNDNESGCLDSTSFMQVPMVEGEEILLRVGGFADGLGFEASGTGTLTLTEIESGCLCDANVTGGSLNVLDVVTVEDCVVSDLCGGCTISCDINCDGAIDFIDLGVVDCAVRGFSGCCDEPVGACIGGPAGEDQCAVTLETFCASGIGGSGPGVYLGDGTICDIPAPPVAGSNTYDRTLEIIVPAPTSGAAASVAALTAFRVTLVTLYNPNDPQPQPPQDFSANEGKIRYLNLLRDGSGAMVTDCVSSAAQATTYPCITVGCDPEFADWEALFGGRIAYVSGNAIIPDSTYTIAHLAASCTVANAATCSAVSQEVPFATARYGDVQPDGLVTVADVVFTVDAVKQLAGSVFKYQVYVRHENPVPQFSSTGVGDIVAHVDALKLFAYQLRIFSCP